MNAIAREPLATRSPNRLHRMQRGAALVVGLVLLLILTLLAISGMTTATTELTMAGNSQYQTRAFQAAETGIEQIIAAGTFNPAVPTVTVTATLDDQDEDTEDDDTYEAVTTAEGSAPPPPGYSFGTFSTEHFQIRSRGESLRNASATHTQGLWVVAPAAP